MNKRTNIIYLYIGIYIDFFIIFTYCFCLGVNAAMAAYQSALLSAMAAQTHTFPTSLTGELFQF